MERLISARRGSKDSDNCKEFIIDVARVTQVTKGGRNFSFSAFAVIGNQKGKIGYGHGKDSDVSEAKRKAVFNAKRNLRSIPISRNKSVFHPVINREFAAKVKIMPAPPGTGVKAGGALRPIFYLLGIENVVSKSSGGKPYNVAKCAIHALESTCSPRDIAKKRGRSVSDILV